MPVVHHLSVCVVFGAFPRDRLWASPSKNAFCFFVNLRFFIQQTCSSEYFMWCHLSASSAKLLILAGFYNVCWTRYIEAILNLDALESSCLMSCVSSKVDFGYTSNEILMVLKSNVQHVCSHDVVNVRQTI